MSLQFRFTWQPDPLTQSAEVYADFLLTLNSTKFRGDVFCQAYQQPGAMPIVYCLAVVAIAYDGQSEYYCLLNSYAGDPTPSTFSTDFPDAISVVNLINGPDPVGMLAGSVEHWSFAPAGGAPAYQDFVTVLDARKFNGYVFFYNFDNATVIGGIHRSSWMCGIYAVSRDFRQVYTFSAQASAVTPPALPSPMPSTFATDFPSAIEWQLAPTTSVG